MTGATKHVKSYNRPVEVADGIYWVGFHDPETNLHCNPYLIVEGSQAVLIDAGSRPDFALVMMKILQTGVSPEQIVALVYQHPDPDLCGSMPNMVDICANPQLRIISDEDNNLFISFYLEKEKRSLLTSLNESRFTFTFGDRTLQFIKTPYAHASGSFVTYDTRTKTLFTSDLFGSMSKHWELFTHLGKDCRVCRDYDRCILRRAYCPLPDIIEFHRKVMPSRKALRYAMKVIGGLDVEILAPQHGSIMNDKEDISFLIARLCALEGVGIDGVPSA